MLRVILALLPSLAQADQWTGTWRMSVRPWNGSTAIILDWQIGIPEQGLLYPTKIKLRYGQFTGIYEALLIKKADGQLGISRGKYPLQETPFKLGIWLWYLNGTLDLKGREIALHRKWVDKFGIWMRGLSEEEDDIWESSKVNLRNFLYRDSITLQKIDDIPLADSSVQRILDPEKSGIYLGKYDRTVTTDSLALLKVEDQQQYDRDTVTLLHNGRPLFRMAEVNDHNRQQQVRLDTGRNLFFFFAENCGNIPPNTGFLYMKTGGREYGLNFSNRSNVFATFLIADIYYNPTGDHLPTGGDHLPTGDHHLDSLVSQRVTASVATFKVDTAAIVLELWDSEIEDGDSISLRLNGHWITTGFPVSNTLQKIPIQLQPGENRILFMADNLGRIPPNTARLRIRYGARTQTLDLNTDMRKNNEIRLILGP
jgi:hypothetical protein